LEAQGTGHRAQGTGHRAQGTGHRAKNKSKKEKVERLKINLEEYNYDLPEERIAQYPADERDMSNLLVYRGGKISKDIFRNVDTHLPPDSFLVFNNTRVIRARLLFRKDTGAAIEVLCLEPILPFEYELSLGSKKPVEWKCIIGNLKKWKAGILKTEFAFNGKQFVLSAEKVKQKGEAWILRFSWTSDDVTFGEVIELAGHIPLPPYIEREDEANDNFRYQTVYSKIQGSVAAPTAGLHFTENVFNKLNNKGIRSDEITLHVGAGTFKPIKSDSVFDHEMHCEHFYVKKETIKAIIKNEGKVIAVGTTSVRTLESLYWMGVKLLADPLFKTADSQGIASQLSLRQWEPYEINTTVSVRESLETLLNYMIRWELTYLHASTSIMIIPSYKFRIVNGLITNFHQPGSTLLLLISAWIGEDWKNVYKFALENNFRFLSYGDSSVLLR
jgi:S-adenosylmethionine:tRNA ribosyltransferase-isomerase